MRKAWLPNIQFPNNTYSPPCKGFNKGGPGLVARWVGAVEEWRGENQELKANRDCRASSGKLNETLSQKSGVWGIRHGEDDVNPSK